MAQKMDKPNYYHDTVKKIKKNSVVIEKEITLDEGKTTTKGEYAKLSSDSLCKYPERDCCNYGEFFSRCEYMECISFGHWRCTFKNAKKTT